MKKSLKEFIQENDVTGFELVNNVILSVVVDNITYALDVDTSEIPYGMLVQRVNEFIIEEDILSVNNVSININNVNVYSIDYDY